MLREGESFFIAEERRFYHRGGFITEERRFCHRGEEVLSQRRGGFVAEERRFCRRGEEDFITEERRFLSQRRGGFVAEEKRFYHRGEEVLSQRRTLSRNGLKERELIGVLLLFNSF